MALKNTVTGEYLRILTKDTAPFNLANKQFHAEKSRDEDTRDNPGEYDKPKYIKLNFGGNLESGYPIWELEITGVTSFDDLATEGYRCLKLSPEFGPASDWVDTEDL